MRCGGLRQWTGSTRSSPNYVQGRIDQERPKRLVLLPEWVYEEDTIIRPSSGAVKIRDKTRL